MQVSKTSTIREGTTDLVVPDLEEPQMIPGFFNPQGRLVRDVSIVCYRAYASLHNKSGMTFADSLSGVGARGIRVANETTEYAKIYLNDINSFSLDLAKKSAKMNHVDEKCVFTRTEACSFLSSREIMSGDRFDVVDLDPFGTPSPFVDCVLRSVRDGGLVSISATDSAVLCGVYPRVALRKYLGLPLRTDYSHEMGIRLLFGLIASAAMRTEVGIEPQFCHHDRHYFRVYFELRVGNRYSIQNEEEYGFVLHCFNCGYRTVVKHSDFTHSRKQDQDAGDLNCPKCMKSKVRVGGPLWIGKIQSQNFVMKCKGLYDIPMFNQELDLPLYYDLTSISQDLGLRTPRINELIDLLKSNGRSASRTRLNPKAVRTDAPLEELRSLLAELAR